MSGEVKALASIVFLFSLTSVSAQEVHFTGSADCGRCHQQIEQQWSTSMHSRSATNALYRQVLEKVIEDSDGRQTLFCLSCHAPVASVTGQTQSSLGTFAWDRLSHPSEEGVTCDFCHTLSVQELKPNILPGAFVYPRSTLQTGVKYGPRGEMVDAHETASSDFLASSKFCATCHHFTHPLSHRLTQSTYTEWQRSRYAREGIHCQDCHMRPVQGTPTMGRPTREFAEHGFPGGQRSIRSEAVTLVIDSARLTSEAGVFRVDVQVSATNSGAGHSIPTGVPGIREIWMETKLLTESGEVLEEQRRSYVKKLIAKDGSDALPWEAYKVVEDTRIRPDETRTEAFQFDLSASAGRPTQVEVRLVLGLVAESMARRLSLSPPEPELMVSVRRPLS